MHFYSICHTSDPRVVDEVIDYLWQGNKIAIRYPEHTRQAQDLISFNEDHYEKRFAKEALHLPLTQECQENFVTSPEYILRKS